MMTKAELEDKVFPILRIYQESIGRCGQLAEVPGHTILALEAAAVHAGILPKVSSWPLSLREARANLDTFYDSGDERVLQQRYNVASLNILLRLPEMGIPPHLWQQIRNFLVPVWRIVKYRL